MDPLLKWAGGKRLLLDKIKKRMDVKSLKNGTSKYFEPFIGGGSVCFDIEAKNCYISDSNSELINFYRVIKDSPEELIIKLKEFKADHNSDFYYKVRDWDRMDDFSSRSSIERAARFLYLNKTCYNGLYRENNNGNFNVPIGKYVNPDIVPEKKIRDLHNYFTKNKVEIECCDFSKIVDLANKGDVIYFDPPYDYDDEGFTKYVANDFTRNDLNRLKAVTDELINKGCRVIISNNDTQYVNRLFNNGTYKIDRITVTRFISCNGEKREKANEVIIYG